MQCGFTANADTTENPTNEHFYLHNHDDYEIYMFLEGDSSYRVEGVDYLLEPRDIIIIRKHEMHRVFHNGPALYRRIVLNVSPQFFSDNGCTEYERQFSARGRDGNKICADTVVKSGLYDAFMRLKNCSGEFSDINTPIARAIVVEILYLINSVCTFIGPGKRNEPVQKIINYINNRYTDNLSLDELERRFFVSKYHICHIFREATGLTVHRYIRRKRLTLVRELTACGNNLGEAAQTAGFGTYSSFYRAYTSEFGAPPREIMPDSDLNSSQKKRKKI